MNQKEYYNLDTIRERLREALGSDEWEKLKNTKLGEALVNVGANIIQQNALSFFNGLNQFFLSTVDQEGYLEEIAKNNGILPETYTSANFNISLYSNDGKDKYFSPLELSVRIGGYYFYNIDDVLISGSSTTPTSVTFYQGNLIREATSTGGDYNQVRNPLPEMVNNKIIRKYFLLPTNTVVNSINVYSAANLDFGSFTRYFRVNRWFDVSADEKVFKVEKDFIGRYKVLFGDGDYGQKFPTSKTVILHYLLSDGDDIDTDDISINVDNISIYNSLEGQEITNNYNIVGVSDISEGYSSIDFKSLKLDIERSLYSKNSIILKKDYLNYLQSRRDVMYAVVKVERDAEPPNIEYFNTIKYSVKPYTEGGSFNKSEINRDINTYGLKTVEFEYVEPEKIYFDFSLGIGALAGYSANSVEVNVTNILSEELSWEGLGFNEVLNSSRIINAIKDVTGLDLSKLNLDIDLYYTKAGETVFDFNPGDTIYLDKTISRFNLNINSDVFSTIRDNGLGELYGNFEGNERFDFNNYDSDLSSNSLIYKDVLFFTDNGFSGDNPVIKVMDLKQDAGFVSELVLPIDSSDWSSLESFYIVEGYDIILTLIKKPDNSLVLYMFRLFENFNDETSYNYIHLVERYYIDDVLYSKSTGLGISNYDSSSSLFYYRNYIYFIYKKTDDSCELRRYKFNINSINDFDSTYNSGVGYLTLYDGSNGYKPYFDTTVTTGIEDEDIIWIASESDIEVVRKFSNPDECVHFTGILSNIFDDGYDAITSIDTDNSVLYVTCNNITGDYWTVLRLYAIDLSANTANYDILLNNSAVEPVSSKGLMCLNYSDYYSKRRLYFYYYNDDNATIRKFMYVYYDEVGQGMIYRAGQDSGGNDNSILKVADIFYFDKKVVLDSTLINSDLVNTTIIYKSEGDVVFEDFDMPIMKNMNVYIM